MVAWGTKDIGPAVFLNHLNIFTPGSRRKGGTLETYLAMAYQPHQWLYLPTKENKNNAKQQQKHSFPNSSHQKTIVKRKERRKEGKEGKKKERKEGKWLAA